VKAGPKDNMGWDGAARSIGRNRGVRSTGVPTGKRQDYSLPSISVVARARVISAFVRALQYMHQGFDDEKGMVPASTRRLATRLTPPVSDHQVCLGGLRRVVD
jgi:hypothetical protein